MQQQQYIKREIKTQRVKTVPFGRNMRENQRQKKAATQAEEKEKGSGSGFMERERERDCDDCESETQRTNHSLFFTQNTILYFNSHDLVFLL